MPSMPYTVHAAADAAPRAPTPLASLTLDALGGSSTGRVLRRVLYDPARLREVCMIHGDEAVDAMLSYLYEVEKEVDMTQAERTFFEACFAGVTPEPGTTGARLRDEGRQEGRQEGREEGRKALRRVAEHAMVARFGDAGAARLRGALHAASLGALTRAMTAVTDGASIDAVLAELEG